LKSIADFAVKIFNLSEKIPSPQSAAILLFVSFGKINLI
jgi:hypothetical protein